MCGKKTCMVYLIVSVIAFLIFSSSFLLMLIESNEAKQGINVFSLIAALMFWLGLIVGVVMQVILSVNCKKWFARKRTRLSYAVPPKLGLISFFKNKTAVIFDVLLILSLIGFLILNILEKTSEYVFYVCIAFISFSFCAHCIFNGKNFFFIFNKAGTQKTNEKPHTNTFNRGGRKNAEC